MAEQKPRTLKVQTFAAHQVITQPNPLRKVMRRIDERELDDPVARAEQALADLSVEFNAWMSIECARLGAAYAAVHGGTPAAYDTGAERAMLLPLPLMALRLPPEIVASLARVGLKRIRDIADLPRTTHGNTGIGRGVAAAVDLLAGSEGCASRSVVNVSGDGPESLAPRPRFHMPLATARQRAADLGITINALAIETEAADLADWYRDNLITGPGAFVMKVDGFEDFAAAIEAKLVREITPLALAAWEPDLRSLTFTAAAYQAPDRRTLP
ncbi:MAG: hypothetical protein B7Y02_02770 [Rhodobacterales bacterium 17-64-5]|nr:MAG: hypothetical protein B7Y02_02770 [Rhodobacterales bacterium 17-64-5]